MFTFLGNSIARRPLVYLALWLLILAGTWLVAPKFRDVAEDKGFGFLPPDAPSRQAEQMFEKAFPDERFSSNVVLVIRRQTDESSLARVKKFIEDYLEPGLRKIADEEGGLAIQDTAVDDAATTDETVPAPKRRSILARIRTPNAPGSGALYVSEDERAALVLVDLTTDLLTRRNSPTLKRIEKLMASLETEGHVPPGCDLSLTGSAVIGRDYLQAQKESSRATEFWTVVLVVALLLIIYRAPLVALIPLATVFVSVQIALKVLTLLAEFGYINLFEGIQVFITVLTYGAGVDYCLFLTARYKEELDAGRDAASAVSAAVHRVGAAVLASAATVMGGIAMLIFARFGKFHEAGVVIPIALSIVLAATLTFTPALLRLAGRSAFWPYASTPTHHEDTQHWLWRKMGQILLLRPGTVWLATVLLMAPFAIVAVFLSRHLTYDMVSNLPEDAPSVTGTRVLTEHFPTGIMGPIAVLVVNPQADFASKEGRDEIARMTDALRERAEELELVDLRSLTAPLGITSAAQRALEGGELPRAVLERGIQRDARDRYITDLGERRKIGARFDIVLEDNPFSVLAIQNLSRVETVVRESLPGELKQGAQLYFTGATASIRDLRDVTIQDQTRVEVLVLISVFFILLALLRQGVICLYLLLSVLFSYYTALGVTFALFWALNPAEFSGLDWKVTMFLFTILIAVGEDYNIFLMTRIREEQEAHGLTAGMMRALTRTGPIISSCGIIMAGTFCSLMAGTLTEMKQLGFALAFGVLLDTFVVRPILVPSFLLLFQHDQLSPARLLGLRQKGMPHSTHRLHHHR